MDQRNSNCSGISGAQLRKIRKPLIERKRRERINDSLNQLKTLVLEALCKDESNCSKMDKADILEMAVQHLRAMHHQQQQQQKSVHYTSRQQHQQYSNGFSECSKQVDRFLGSATGVQPDLSSRVSRHLISGVNAEPRSVEMSPSYSVPVASPVASLPGSPTYRAATDSMGSPLTVHLPRHTSPHSVSFRPVVIAPLRRDSPRTTSPQLADDAPSARLAASPTSFVHSSPEGAVKDTHETDFSMWRPW